MFEIEITVNGQVFRVNEANLASQMRRAHDLAEDPRVAFSFIDASFACEEMRAAVYGCKCIRVTITRWFNSSVVVIPYCEVGTSDTIEEMQDVARDFFSAQFGPRWEVGVEEITFQEYCSLRDLAFELFRLEQT